jgi:hypothetical protein
MKIERFKYGGLVRELTIAADDVIQAAKIHYDNVDGGTQPAGDLVAEKSLVEAGLARANNAATALSARLVELERRIRAGAPQAAPARRPAKRPARSRKNGRK